MSWTPCWPTRTPSTTSWPPRSTWPTVMRRSRSFPPGRRMPRPNCRTRSTHSRRSSGAGRRRGGLADRGRPRFAHVPRVRPGQRRQRRGGPDRAGAGAGRRADESLHPVGDGGRPRLPGRVDPCERQRRRQPQVRRIRDARAVPGGLLVDYENGLVLARQNPSVDLFREQVRVGTPTVRATQRRDGSVFIRYAAADPFSPGGEDLAKASVAVRGELVVQPGPSEVKVGGCRRRSPPSRPTTTGRWPARPHCRR